MRRFGETPPTWTNKFLEIDLSYFISFIFLSQEGKDKEL
jgi:hypothetical protein